MGEVVVDELEDAGVHLGGEERLGVLEVAPRVGELLLLERGGAVLVEHERVAVAQLARAVETLHGVRVAADRKHLLRETEQRHVARGAQAHRRAVRRRGLVVLAARRKRVPKQQPPAPKRRVCRRRLAVAFVISPVNSKQAVL